MFTQDISSMKTWENILQTPELVEYFRGIFNHLGISIEETGESFTIHHTGQGFAFEKGIDQNSVDFTVPIELQNIQNMVHHAKDGKNQCERIMENLGCAFYSHDSGYPANPSFICKLEAETGGRGRLNSCVSLKPIQ